MRLLLFLFSVVIAGSLYAGKGDTAIYRRTYYLGLTSAYSTFQEELRTPTQYVNALVQIQPGATVLHGGGLGLVYDFPFASRFSCEINAQYFRYTGYRTMASGYVIDSDGSDLHMSGYKCEWFNSNEMNCRLVFAAELLRNSRFSIHAGLGGWGLAAGNRESGNVAGVEAIVKSWIPVSRGSAVQAGLIYGVTGSGTYIQLRAAFAVRGTRIYRHRPSKYYVRTYEEGE